jgi:hypothetical protein
MRANAPNPVLVAFLCAALLPVNLHASPAAKKHARAHTLPAKATPAPGRTLRKARLARSRTAPREIASQHPPSAHPESPTARRVHAFIEAQQQRSAAPPSLAAVAARLPSVEEVVATPVLLPTLYNRRGRLIMPAPLKGSREILLHQNEIADRDGLTRIQNEDDLDRMRRDGLLVSLPTDPGLQIDLRLPANRRYCRPWTAFFLAQLSREYYARFHTPLFVTSAVRTVEVQQHLLRINGNAAPVDGDTASPHLTGQAIDIAKHGLTLTQIAWLRGYLLPLVQQQKADVEEEFQQACFHISVYPKYGPQPPALPRHFAGRQRDAAAALAVTLP